MANYGFKGFCIAYLGAHFFRELGAVHWKIISLLDDDEAMREMVISFRESGKSTLVTLAYALYAGVTKRRNFIILIGDTFSQAELMVQNLKYELENNRLLLEDFGNLQTDQWSASRLVLSSGCRYLPRSKGQKVRGLKHKMNRPDLILVDDPESADDVKTKENRDKTYRWFTGEVMGAVDKEKGKIFVIGNLLHSDALLPRLHAKGLFNRTDIPILLEGHTTWEAVYPDEASVEKERKRHDPIFWAREYELKIIAEEGQIIMPEDITYYDQDAQEPTLMSFSGVGVDLAISQKQGADYTAMVGGRAYQIDGTIKIRVYPKVINKHLDFHQTQIEAKNFALLVGRDYLAHLFVEDVAYQKAAIQELTRRVMPVTGVKIANDKRARLQTIAPLIRNGTIQFPEKGCEDLLIQLFGFGTESHDDMVDAMVHMIAGLSQWGIQEVVWLD